MVLPTVRRVSSKLELTRVRNRWTRYDLIVIDELGYVVMPDAAAELLFQVIADAPSDRR